MSQGLHCLAEPHIVGKDAAQLVFAQELEPVQPIALIGTQLGLEPGRWLDLGDPGKARQPLRQCSQTLTAEPAQPDRRFERGEPDRLAGRYPDPALARNGLGMIELDQGRQDRLGAVERQCHMATVRQCAEDPAVMRQRVEPVGRAEVAQPRQQRGQDRQQRHRRTVDLDAEIERKPPSAPLLDVGHHPPPASTTRWPKPSSISIRQPSRSSCGTAS